MPNCNSLVHTLKEGESLWSVSELYGVSLNDIIEVNPEIFDFDGLGVGQEICLPNKVLGRRESLSYLYGGTTSEYLNYLSKTGNSIKTICPDSFEVSGDGNLLIAPSYKLNSQFVNEVKNQGIKITPFLTNNWSRNLGSKALDNRENLSTELAQAVFQFDLDGVNIDIENVTEIYREKYVEFVKMIREKLPEKIISVAVAANPNGWAKGWHGSYDYKALSEYADYLVIMAYDESYQGSDEGPVSSSSFFENSIKFALNEGVSKEKIVVAIPFFGRYWKVGESFGGIGIADADIENLLENYSSVSRFYDATKSAFAVVTIGGNDPKPEIFGSRFLSEGIYHIWYDSEESTRYKLSLIDDYDLKGAGSWALGQENLNIWNFYTSVLNENYSKGIDNDMTREETFNFIYPVGSIYMSVNSANPGNLFGGTWVRFANGRTIFSVNENDLQGLFNVSEKIGGESEHRHNFRVGMHWWYGSACGEGAGNGTGAYRYSDGRYDGWARNLDSKNLLVNSANYNSRSAIETNCAGKWSLGDTDTSKNLPPYITCYVWKRIS